MGPDSVLPLAALLILLLDYTSPGKVIHFKRKNVAIKFSGSSFESEKAGKMKSED